jgi:BirA family transcriptional regulator, biotin operon repressor / biotin---[acetyl-CoA-carboxylase] ligase
VIAFVDGEIDTARWRTLENYIAFHAIPSSNAVARELIETYFAEDQNLPTSVLVAEAQTEAYGRLGRAWRAPLGRGLYLTIVRRVAEGEPLSVVPIAVARWICDALREATGAEIELKWPNDLYVRRRKLAGVIAESRTQGEDTYVAVGVGVNVLGPAGELGVEGATTLEEELGRAFAMSPLLQAVLDRLDRELAEPRWEEEVRRWEQASLHRPGDVMTVRRNGEDVTGRYVGLDKAGFLRLQTESGETVVASGEVARW